MCRLSWPSKPCEPAKSIVAKVSGVLNDSNFSNFFMWSRAMMLKSPVEEAKMSISGTTTPMPTSWSHSANNGDVGDVTHPRTPRTNGQERNPNMEVDLKPTRSRRDQAWKTTGSN